MKFSIIVPIFNAEKYLEHCIESLLNQEMSDYEILLINDGSTDNSSKICEKYKTNPSVILLEQSNKGPSATRNRGIEQSKGEYIIFIDADDFISECVLSRLYKYLQQKDLEVATFNYRCYSEKGVLLREHCPSNLEDNKVISGVDYICKYGMNIFKTAWMYVYSKKFIESYQLKFAEGLYHEDCEWTSQWLPCVKKMGYLNLFFYNQIMSNHSIMRSKNIKKSKDLIEISTLIHKNASRASLTKVQKELHKYGAFEAWSAVHSCISQGFKLNALISSDDVRDRICENIYDNLRYRLIWILIKFKLYRVVEWIVIRIDSLRKYN